MTKCSIVLFVWLVFCVAQPALAQQPEGGRLRPPEATPAVRDPELAKWGLIILGIVASLTLVAAGSVGLALIWNQTEQSQQVVNEAIRGGIVLRMGTIFGLVMTAGILALSGTLSEGTMALLSGIAGYVLGGIRGSNASPGAEPASSKRKTGAEKAGVQDKEQAEPSATADGPSTAP